MYAIVQIGSLQYKVSEGDTIDTQLIAGKEGKSVTLDNVLLFSEGQTVKIGQPYLKDVKVTAMIQKYHRGNKTLSFKYRRRKNSAWRKGHRQELTNLRIEKIAASK